VIDELKAGGGRAVKAKTSKAWPLDESGHAFRVHHPASVVRHSSRVVSLVAG
jgi:hypothetical protein